MSATVIGEAASSQTVAQLQREWETPRGLRGALGSVDHKTIGKRYLVTAFLFLILGGLEAGAMRLQLSQPNQHLLSPEQYNQLFSVHGVTMIFLYASPILSGFSNYLWPLMLGSRDMAFPRLNALSFWVYLCAGLFIYSSVLVGQMPNAGWFDYVPLASRQYNPGLNIDFYTLGLTLLTISTTVGAINFIVTLFKTRAPGMSLNRLPILVWGTLTASVANVLALPALTAACVFLFFDRRFGTHFYDPAAGGHPLLWQHLFWIFGHPWVYVIVLPAMGMVSDILPTFCRRPLVGYTLVALATVTTGIFGFGVWVHHMFATGLPTTGMSFFGGASMMIAIPSAVGVFAWLSTIWYGRPRFTTSFLFMVGFVALFTIGGVSGVMTAAVPFDWQLTDTYFIVAHIHYVLVGINVFPVIGALYYWYPKMTGRLMNEYWGKWSFWLMFVGTNVVFFPMHILGMLGMPRRIYTYGDVSGWGALNLLETVGAFILALGVLVVVVNVIVSLRRGARAGDNPWEAGTLEWSTSSPPPPYNFAVIPIVASRHPLWEAELDEGSGKSQLRRGLVLAEGRETVGTTPLDAEPSIVMRMPGDSMWPLVLALSLTLLMYGLLATNPALIAVGAFGVALAAIGWLWPEELHAEARADTALGELPVGGAGDRGVGWWGMSCLIATEGAFFAYLLFSYFYLASHATNPWPTGGAPALKLVAINTAILLASSVVLEWARRGLHTGAIGRVRAGIALTMLLGVAFLGLQLVEYHGKPFAFSADAYSSLFYTITGFHGAHVALGVIMLGVVLARTIWRPPTAGRHIWVTNAALYWHFVDVVWLFVFTALYLTPRFV